MTDPRKNLDRIGFDFPELRRYRFEFQALEPIELPPYSGSAWRGLLGHGLRRAVCVTRQKSCDGCLLRGSCAYSVLFESPSPGSHLQARTNALPHPFVLSPPAREPRTVAAGTRLRLGVTLLGPGLASLPYLIRGFELAGERGIGKGYGRFALSGVQLERAPGSRDWQRIYRAGDDRLREIVSEAGSAGASEERTRITLETPLRIKRGGSLVGPGEFTARHLLQQLRWRLDALARLYGKREAPIDWSAFHAAAQHVRLTEKLLSWRDWTRYSSRQKERMRMGGLVGDLLLEGEGVARLWSHLWLGQWLHLGKATSMGLGRYRMVDAAPPPEPPGERRPGAEQCH